MKAFAIYTNENDIILETITTVEMDSWCFIRDWWEVEIDLLKTKGFTCKEIEILEN